MTVAAWQAGLSGRDENRGAGGTLQATQRRHSETRRDAGTWMNLFREQKLAL